MKIVLHFLLIFASSSVAAQSYLGTWFVDKIAASSVTNLTQEEASLFIGKQLNFLPKKVSLSDRVCGNARYHEESFNDQALHSYHRVFFSDLEITDVHNVTNIEVFCNDKPWYKFGAFLIKTGSRLFVSYSGYIYELRRKNTQQTHQ